MKVYIVVEVETDNDISELKGLTFKEAYEIIMKQAEKSNTESFKTIDVFETMPIEQPKKAILKDGDCESCYGCGNVLHSYPNMCFVCKGTGKKQTGGSDELRSTVNNSTPSI